LRIAAKIESVDTAFEESEFHQFIVEATEYSLNAALDLFEVPGAINVTLRGRAPPVADVDEVRASHLYSATRHILQLQLRCTSQTGWVGE